MGSEQGCEGCGAADRRTGQALVLARPWGIVRAASAAGLCSFGVRLLLLGSSNSSVHLLVMQLLSLLLLLLLLLYFLPWEAMSISC